MRGENGKIVMAEWEKKNLLNELESDESVMRQNQAGIRKNWSILNKYIAGFQIYDPKSGQYLDHRQALRPTDTNDVDQEAVICNDILRQHVANVERLSNYTLDPQVVPDSSEPSAKRGARYGTMFLKDLIRKEDEERIKRRVAAILDKFGAVFLKTLFDPTRGRKILKPEINSLGNWEFADDLGFEGEVTLDVVSPENIFLPRFTTDFRDVDDVEEINVRSVDYVWRRYKQTIKPEDVQASDSGLTSIMDAEAPNQRHGETGSASNHVLVKERWFKSCIKYPRGAHLVWANKVLLMSSELDPYYPGLPYFTAQMIFQEKSPFGDTLLWHLLPYQDMKNKGVTAAYRHIDLMSQNKWLLPRSSEVNPDDIDNSSGGTVSYVPGQHGEKPEIMRPPELQQTVLGFTQYMDVEAMKIGANHDISRGSRPPSGNAIGALQDMDNAIVGPTIKSLAEAFSNAFTFALELVARYYDTDHLIKSGGGTKPWSITPNFRGEMLEDQTHATVNLMTGVPSNRFAKLQFLTEMFKIKLLAADEVKPYLEFGDLDKSLQDIQEDQEIADAIVEKLSNEESYQSVIPHDFDNHEVIIKALIATMRREDYDTWPVWKKTAFVETKQWHQDHLAQSVATARGMAMGAPAPVGPGMPQIPQIPEGLAPIGEVPQDQPPADMQVSPVAPGFGNAPGV